MEKYLAIYENGFTKSRKSFIIERILDEFITNNGIEDEFDEECINMGYKPYYKESDDEDLEDLTDDIIWDIFFNDMDFVGIDEEVDICLVENGYLPYYQFLYEMREHPELEDNIIEIEEELGLPSHPSALA